MRKTRSWKHIKKQPKQYGNRESERTAWSEIMLADELYLVKMEDDHE